MHFLHIEVPDHIKTRGDNKWAPILLWINYSRTARQQISPSGTCGWPDSKDFVGATEYTQASAGKNQHNQSAASRTGQAFRATDNQRTDYTCEPKKTDVLLSDVPSSRTSVMTQICLLHTKDAATSLYRLQKSVGLSPSSRIRKTRRWCQSVTRSHEGNPGGSDQSGTGPQWEWTSIESDLVWKVKDTLYKDQRVHCRGRNPDGVPLLCRQDRLLVGCCRSQTELHWSRLLWMRVQIKKKSKNLLPRRPARRRWRHQHSMVSHNTAVCRLHELHIES